MNQTSLSVSDVGKSSALLQVGGESKESSDSESGVSFLSTLGALFQTDTESTEKTSESESKGSEGELSLANIDELAELDPDLLLEGEEGEATTGGDIDASELLADTDSELSESTQQNQVTNNVRQAMDEGNELLERLDDASQVLTKGDGKSLPPEVSSRQNEDRITPSLSKEAMQLTARREGLSSELEQPEVAIQLIPEEEKASADIEVKGEVVKIDALADKPKAESRTPFDQMIAASSLSAVEVQPEFTESQLAAAVKETVATPLSSISSDEMLSLEDAPILQQAVLSDELVWDVRDEQTTDTKVLAEAELQVPNQKQAVLSMVNNLNVDQLKNDAKFVATLERLNLSDVPLESLSEDELEYLVQLSAASTPSDSVKVSPEVIKSNVMTGVNQQSSQSASQAQHLQQLQQAQQGAERIQAQANAASTASEVNLAQLQQPQPMNPAIAAAVSHTVPQQQILKNVAALSGLMGAQKGVAKAESSEPNSGLASQLSGLVSQQGTQQSAIRTEMQQAVQNSPLQLSREAAGERLSEQVQMMMSKNLKNIDIRLDPPELGRMQIRMSMNGDGAAVQFTVANQQARDLVDQAMPRLREMLAQQGVQLTDSSVHQQSAGQQHNQYAAGDDGKSGNGSQGTQAEGELNLDESINLDVNIQSKDDGISYYA